MELKTVKIALIGVADSGKSCLASMFAKEPFQFNYKPTIGLDLKVYYDTKHEFKIYFWDTAGSTNFRYMVQTFIPSCRMIAFCFSAPSYESYKEMVQLYNFYTDNNLLIHKSVFVIATKIDKCRDRQYENWAKEFTERTTLPVFFTSAKKNLGWKQIIDYIMIGNINLPSKSPEISRNYKNKNNKKKVKFSDKDQVYLFSDENKKKDCLIS